MCSLVAVVTLGGCAGSDDDGYADELAASSAALSLDGGVEIVAPPSVVFPPSDVDIGPIPVPPRPALDGGIGPKPDGGGPDGGGSSFLPVGLWHFDDCTAASTTLIDSSPTGSNAVRSADLTCAEGISGAGVHFDGKRDTIEADNPAAFALGQGMTVGAWVNLDAVGQGTIVNKQKPNGLTFELSLDRK